MNVLNIAVRIAEETQFDPDTASPGVAGFFAFAALGVGIILLGFSLVSRLRRNAYRAEVQEQIAEELAAAAGDPGAAAGTDASEDPEAGAGSGEPADPEDPAGPSSSDRRS